MTKDKKNPSCEGFWVTQRHWHWERGRYRVKRYFKLKPKKPFLELHRQQVIYLLFY